MKLPLQIHFKGTEISDTLGAVANLEPLCSSCPTLEIWDCMRHDPMPFL
jgi:hypothetical protein